MKYYCETNTKQHTNNEQYQTKLCTEIGFEITFVVSKQLL